jgi:hypothetical protein
VNPGLDPVLQGPQTNQIAYLHGLLQVAAGDVKLELIAWGKDLQDLQAQIPPTNDEKLFALHDYLPDVRRPM